MRRAAVERPPAFQFYPKDFLSDSHVAAMTLPERGAYITLLCHCWLEGFIPASPAALARLCKVSPASFARLWLALEPCFRPDRDGDERLIHPRLEREREKQAAFREAGRQGGLRSAAKRLGTPLEKGLVAKSNSSSSSSTPEVQACTTVKRTPKPWEQKRIADLKKHGYA